MNDRTGSPEIGVEAAPAAGLVSCAIVPPLAVPDDLAALGSLLHFPSAEMMGAAAGMFPPAVSAHEGTHFHLAESFGYQVDAFGRRIRWERRDRSWAEYSTENEGVFPRLFIGPGMVQFARRNDAQREVTRAAREGRERDERRRRAEHESAMLNMPMWAAPAPWRESEPCRFVSAWSRKSRSALRRKIASLDLSRLVEGDRLPALLTLTLPGDWLAVAPDSATAARKFDRFCEKWRRKFGPMECIWKREFQRRGAPHWHLWLVPPVDRSGMAEFREWVSRTWTRILFKDVDWSYGADHDGAAPRCSCSEYCRSLGAGTGVDFASALRSSDPNRLAEYFLKESGHSEAKAYQNEAPIEWAGQSIGRFWGVRNIPDAVLEVAIRPQDQYVLWRVLRKVRAHRSVPRQFTVDRGLRFPAIPSGISAHPESVGYSVLHQPTGELRRRRVNRRSKVSGVAGWVALNNGAAFAADLGRYATLVAAPVACADRAAGAVHDCESADRRECIASRTSILAVSKFPEMGG